MAHERIHSFERSFWWMAHTPEAMMAATADQGRILLFDEFFEKESDPLFRRMWLVTGNRSEAEEITQEAFLRILPRWNRVGRLEDPAGYLYRAAFNLVRSRSRRLRVAVRRIVVPDVPRDEFAAAEAKHVLAHAMRSLSPRQRAALVLVELLDCSAEQAGRLLGIRPSTVRSLASQGRAALRQVMGADHD